MIVKSYYFILVKIMNNSKNNLPKIGDRYYYKRSKLLVSVALIISLFILVLGSINFFKNRTNVSLNAYRNLENISNTKIENIAYWKKDKIDDATLLMNDAAQHKFLSDYTKNSDNDSTAVRWMRSLIIHEDIVELILYNTEKKSLLSTDNPEELKEINRIVSFDSSVINRKVIMSDFFIDDDNKEIRLALFIPVFDNFNSKDNVSKVLMVELDPAKSLQRLISKISDNNLSSEAYIVLDAGNEVIFLPDLKNKSNANFNYKIPKSDSLKDCVKAVNGLRGKFEGPDYKGNNVHAFIQEVPNTKWLLISKTNTDEIKENAFSDNNITIIFTLSLVFLALFVTYIYNKKNQEAYFKNLYKEQVTKNIELERFNVLLQNANDNIMLYDENGKCLDANNKALETYGYTLEEITQLYVSDIRAPEKRSDIKELIAKLKNKEGIVFETLHITKSGKIFPVEISATRIDIDGKVFLQGISRDISYRTEFQKKILESEEKFKSVFTYANDVMFIMDSMNLVDVNKNAEIIFEYSHDEMVGLTPADISPEFQSDGKTSSSKASEYVTKALNGEPQFFEWIHKTSSGIEFPSEVSLNSININNKIFVFAVVRDITFRKVLDKSLKEKEESLELALDGSKLGYYDLNLITGAISTNSTCYEILGYEKVDVIQDRKWWRELIHPEDVEISNKVWIDYINGLKNIYQVEVRMRCKDGSYKWILDKCKLFEVSNDGVPIRVVGTHMDITQRRTYEDAIIKAKEAAEESNTLKSNFLTNMSHELRTPLTGILGFSELLLSELENEDHREMVDLILKGGKRLTVTLNSILDLSRLESNQLDIVKDKINVIEIAEDSVVNFSKLASDKNLNLHFESKYQIVHCLIDEKILTDVFYNLLQNAITYTNSGEINVTVNTVKKNNKEYASISVKDTGIGIAKKFHKQIFEPFRQASEGLSRKFEGTGLGLTLTKKYVNMLDGNIELISDEGKGAEFIVTLPLIQATVKPLYIDDKHFEDNDSTLTAVFVEDEVENFELVRMLLKPYMEVVNITSSKDAIEHIKTTQYNMVFMDIGLKDINGIEVTKFIRNLDNYKNIPIIAITAFAMEGDKERILDSGCNEYISKPFTKEDLFAAVGKYIKL